MKRGSKIEVSEKAKYNGQNMNWTEELTGTVTLEAGKVLYHTSRETLLKSFFPKETCFSESKTSDGHYYALKVINTISASLYNNDEWRIDLDECRNDVEIYYIGEIARTKTDEIKPDRRGGFVPVYITVDNTIDI